MEKSISSNNEEVNLNFYTAFLLVWKRKLLLLSITATFSFLSVIYALTLPNYYESSALLMQKEGAEGNSMLSQYSGLASIAGISLPGGKEENKIDLAIAILKSRSFLEDISKEINNFSQIVMASKRYDEVTNTIIFDPKVYDSDKKEWTRKVKPPQKKEPSILELHKVYNQDVFSYYKDKETGYITLSVELISPVHANEFLNKIISRLNDISRQQALEEAQKSLGFLQEELSKTSQISIKDSISKLSDVELNKKMMAAVNKDYLLKIIDPPYIPIFKSSPSRALICIIGFILGVIVSLLYILFLEFYKKRISS